MGTLVRPAVVIHPRKYPLSLPSPTSPTSALPSSPSHHDSSSSSSHEPPRDYPDMSFMSHLSSPSLLHNLHTRYNHNHIYTLVGSSILISINPYVNLPVYSDYYYNLYHAHSQSTSPLPPHVFGIARTAYLSLLKGLLQQSFQKTSIRTSIIQSSHSHGMPSRSSIIQGVRASMNGSRLVSTSVVSSPPTTSSSSSSCDQSILISGESGSGKTEATKLIIAYLSQMSGTGSSIEHQLLHASPILESMGNAATVRNKNSSRFGKWISIRITEWGSIAQGQFLTYLLEESRVTRVSEGERNFHILYQMCAAAKYLETAGTSSDPSLLSLFRMSSTSQTSFHHHLIYPMDFAYLGTTHTLADVDDLQEMDRCLRGMDGLGIARDRQHMFFQLLAAILYMGNITFQNKPGSDAACVVTHDTVTSSCRLPSSLCLTQCAHLLGCSVDTLSHSLCSRLFVAGGRGSLVSVPLSPAQARDTRDSLAKLLYSTLFAHLIHTINTQIDHVDTPRSETTPRRAGVPDVDAITQPQRVVHPPINIAHATHRTEPRPAPTPATACIGILDIFGFESFTTNSFEQLCINYANEKLQQHFVQHLFKFETKLYEAEGITIGTDITFDDNQACLDLMEKPVTGILPLLNEELRLPTPSDERLLIKLHSTHSKHSHYQQHHKDDRRASTILSTFTILHYADSVTYDIRGFIDKNRKQVHYQLIEMLQSSSSSFIQSLFAPMANANATNAANSSTAAVAYQFKQQLDDLLRSMSNTTPYFIRCIKPNSMASCDKSTFDRDLVMRQLQNSGVIDVVKIRAYGYPERIVQQEFYQKYACLLTRHKRSTSIATPRSGPILTQACINILQHMMMVLKMECGDVEDEIKNGWKMGKTKVFLKSSLLSLLESHRTSSLTHIIIRIQSFLRAHIIRHMYQRLRACWYDVRDHMTITCDDDIIKLKAAIERARVVHVPNHMLQKAIEVIDTYQRQQRAIYVLTSVMISHTTSTLLERADVIYAAQLDAMRAGLATTTPIYTRSTSLITTLRTAHPILTSSHPLTETSLMQLRTTLSSLDQWKLMELSEIDIARARLSRADTILDQMTDALSIPQPTSLGGYEQHLTLLCHLYTSAERIPLQHSLCDRIINAILITRAHHLEHHIKQAIPRNDSIKIRECIAWMEQEYDDRKHATSTKIYHIHINKQNICIDVSHVDVMMGMSGMMSSLSQAKTTLEQINAVSQLKSNLQQALHSTDVDVLENAMLQAYTYIQTQSQSQRPSLIQNKSRPGIPPLHHLATLSTTSQQHPDTILFGQLVMAWTSCILHTASSSSSLDIMQQALIRIQDRLTSYQSILHTLTYRSNMETPPPLSASNSVSNSAANSLDVPILARPTSDSTPSHTHPRPKMVNIRTLNRSIQYESDISISQQDESDDDTPHGTLEWKRVGSDLSHVWDHDTSRKNSVIRAARAQQENRTMWQEIEEQLTSFRTRMEQMETRTRVTTRLHDAITHAQTQSNHRRTLSFITQSTISTHDSVLLHHSTLDELRLALAEWRELEHDDVDPIEVEAEKWIRTLSDEETWEMEQKHTVIANIKQHINVAMSDALLIPITTSPRRAQEAIRASRMLPITPTIVNKYLITAQTLLSQTTSLSDPSITLLTTITEHIQAMYTLILAIENHMNVDECLTHVRRMMFHGIVIDHVNWQINAMRWIEAGEEMRSTSPRAKSAMKQHITPRTPAKQVRMATMIEEEAEEHTPRPTKRQVTFDVSAAVAINIPPYSQDDHDHDMYDELSSRMSTRSEIPSRSQWDIEEEMEHVGLKQKILQVMGIKKPMKRRMSISESQSSPRLDVLHVHGEHEADDVTIQLHFMQGSSSAQGSRQTSPRDGRISPREKMNASPSPQPTSRSPTHSVAPSPATSVRGTPLPSLSLGQQPMTRRSTNIPTLSMATSSSGSGSELPSAMTVASMSISATSPTVVHTSRVSSSRSPLSDRSTTSSMTSPTRVSSGSHKRVPPLRLDSVATSIVMEENINEEMGVTYGGAFAALSLSPHDIPPDQVAEERYLQTKDPTICPRPPYSALNPIRGTVMYKRSANKSWFSRFEWKPYLFILDGTWLYYYKTHRDSKPRGVLSIRCCAAQEEPDVTRQLRTRRKPKFAFSCYIQKGWSIHRNLRKPTSYIHRKYFFYVDTFQSMNDWISILNQAGSW